jgi:hypothetical protein
MRPASDARNKRGGPPSGTDRRPSNTAVVNDVVAAFLAACNCTLSTNEVPPLPEQRWSFARRRARRALRRPTKPARSRRLRLIRVASTPLRQAPSITD